MFRLVDQYRVVGFPAIGEFDQGSKLDWFCGRVVVQEVGYSLAADDDASGGGR